MPPTGALEHGFGSRHTIASPKPVTQRYFSHQNEAKKFSKQDSFTLKLLSVNSLR
jgi:hypothetical protein